MSVCLNEGDEMYRNPLQYKKARKLLEIYNRIYFMVSLNRREKKSSDSFHGSMQQMAT